MQHQKTAWIEGLVAAGLLLAANAGLCMGQPRMDWVFVPSEVMAGAWPSLFLHPWVHVSLYHLLLDASAFVSLFFMLERTRQIDRYVITGGAWAGALLATWWWEPAVQTVGLCGLSGIAHGLFAAVCVQWLMKPGLRKTGAVLLGALMCKVLWEVVSGQVLFMSLHPGSVGIPLTMCHAGGVAGAVLGQVASAGRNALLVPS